MKSETKSGTKFLPGDRVVYIREGKHYGAKSTVRTVEGSRIHLKWDKPFYRDHVYSGESPEDLVHEIIFDSPLYKALS